MSIEQYVKFISEQLKANQHSTLRSGEVIMESEHNKHAKEDWDNWDGDSVEDNNYQDSHGNKGFAMPESGITGHLIKHADGKTYSNTAVEDAGPNGDQLPSKTKIILDVKKQNPHLSNEQVKHAGEMIHKHHKECDDGNKARPPMTPIDDDDKP